MSEGFTVRASTLAVTGSVSALEDSCNQIASLVTMALEAAAKASGSASVATAVDNVAVAADKRFLDAAAGYAHTTQGLAGTAKTYQQAEHTIIAKIGAIQVIHRGAP